DAEFPPRVFSHLLRSPRRIKSKRDIDAFDTGYLAYMILDIGHHLWRDWASDSRQRHQDIDCVTLDANVVYQPQINDIHRDFRIVTIAQLLKYQSWLDGRLANYFVLFNLVSHAITPQRLQRRLDQRASSAVCSAHSHTHTHARTHAHTHTCTILQIRQL